MSSIVIENGRVTDGPACYWVEGVASFEGPVVVAGYGDAVTLLSATPVEDSVAPVALRTWEEALYHLNLLSAENELVSSESESASESDSDESSSDVDEDACQTLDCIHFCPNTTLVGPVLVFSGNDASRLAELYGIKNAQVCREHFDLTDGEAALDLFATDNTQRLLAAIEETSTDCEDNQSENSEEESENSESESENSEENSESESEESSESESECASDCECKQAEQTAQIADKESASEESGSEESGSEESGSEESASEESDNSASEESEQEMGDEKCDCGECPLNEVSESETEESSSESEAENMEEECTCGHCDEEVTSESSEEEEKSESESECDSDCDCQCQCDNTEKPVTVESASEESASEESEAEASESEESASEAECCDEKCECETAASDEECCFTDCECEECSATECQCDNCQGANVCECEDCQCDSDCDCEQECDCQQESDCECEQECDCESSESEESEQVPLFEIEADKGKKRALEATADSSAQKKRKVRFQVPSLWWMVPGYLGPVACDNETDAQCLAVLANKKSSKIVAVPSIRDVMDQAVYYHKESLKNEDMIDCGLKAVTSVCIIREEPAERIQGTVVCFNADDWHSIIDDAESNVPEYVQTVTIAPPVEQFEDLKQERKWFKKYATQAAIDYLSEQH